MKPANPKLTSNLETDPAKIALAAEITDRVAKGESIYDIENDQLRAARKALSNGYYYTLSEHEGQFYIGASPIAGWEKDKDYDISSPAGLLVSPFASESVEGEWEFDDEQETLYDAVATLHNAGFQWNAEFQDMYGNNEKGSTIPQQIAAIYKESGLSAEFGKNAAPEEKKNPSSKPGNAPKNPGL